MQRCLITGSAGFIGQNLVQHLTPRIPTVYATTHATLDVLNAPNVERALAHYAPDVVLNCAGNKDLSWCSTNPTRAYELNAIAAGNLAIACRKQRRRYLHISTDYAGELSAYGRSKALGEQLVLEEYPEAIACSVSGVYAPNASWVTWLHGELSAGRKVEAWTNVYNSPLYIGDLADAVYYLSTATVIGGVVKLAGPESVNRYQLFSMFADVFGYDGRLIEPVVRETSLDVSQSCPLFVTKGIREGLEAMRSEMARDELVAENQAAGVYAAPELKEQIEKDNRERGMVADLRNVEV